MKRSLSWISILPAPAVVVAAVAAIAAGCTTAARVQQPAASIETVEFAPSLGILLQEATRLPSGVYFRDITEGTGAVAARGTEITIRYLAFLPDGRHVSGALDAPPLVVRLEAEEVIRGWYDAIPGMRVGGLRRLIIPPDQGYGNRQRGAIPPNSILVFDVELIRVTARERIPNLYRKDR